MKLIPRGRHFKLLIDGYRFTELPLVSQQRVRLIFRDDQENEATLTLDEALTVVRDTYVKTYKGSCPGETFRPLTLARVEEFLGGLVVGAVVEEQGTIQIALDDGAEFHVTPSHGYEGWTLHFRVRGRKLTDEIIGATGHLIIFGCGLK